MKKEFRYKFRYFSVGFMVALLFMGGVSMAASPGTDGDPLVTLGYVEKRFEEFNAYMTLKIEEAVSGSNVKNTAPAAEASKFIVVHVQQGDIIYLGESTEFILRSGEGVAIQSENGGLSDLTSGVDIKGNEAIPQNHQLLIPRDDGRGVMFTSEAYTMVKGSYTLQTAK